MRILVAYGSGYDAAEGIAEGIAQELRATGHDARARTMVATGDLSGYRAFVIGSAVRFGRWPGNATEFVRRNRAALAGRPVWLFSSGSLGIAFAGGPRRDLRDPGEPAHIAQLRETVHPRDHRVFRVALDSGQLPLWERAFRRLDARRALLPAVDAAEWPEVRAWATSIARELATTPLWPRMAPGPTTPCATFRLSRFAAAADPVRAERDRAEEAPGTLFRDDPAPPRAVRSPADGGTPAAGGPRAGVEAVEVM
jgi:menaquinone-dependent protoporphyrinogen oxidase